MSLTVFTAVSSKGKRHTLQRQTTAPDVVLRPVSLEVLNAGDDTTAAQVRTRGVHSLAQLVRAPPHVWTKSAVPQPLGRCLKTVSDCWRRTNGRRLLPHVVQTDGNGRNTNNGSSSPKGLNYLSAVNY